MPATVAYGGFLIVAMMAFSIYAHLAREYRPKLVTWPAVLAGLALVTAYLYGAVAVGPVGEVFWAWFG